MRTPSKSKLYTIVLRYENDMTRTVKVKASTREVAEARALRRNPNAIGVKPSA
jgi:hypothetical protein